MKQIWKSVISGTTTALLLSSTFTSSVWAQCESWESFPEGVEKAKELQMNYRRLFKENKFDEAFPLWEKLFQYVKAPKESPIIHFSDGIKMYKEKIKASQDATAKADFLKKMVELYEQQMKCAGETSLDRAWQGYDMYMNDADPKATLKIFDRAVELSKNDLSQVAFVPMAYLTVMLFDKKDPEITVEYAIKVHDYLKNTAELQVKNGHKDAAKYQEKWAKAEEYFKKIGDKLWGCDFFVNKWKPLFEKDPNNFDQNGKIVDELKAKCGTENDLYKKVYATYRPEKDRRDSVNFWTVEYPTLSTFKKAEANSTWGKKAEKAGRTAEAEKYMAEADRLYEEVVRKGDASLTSEEQGTLAYKVAYKEYKAGNFSEARSLCNKAAEYRPNWGEPLMLIGYMYAASGKRCDPSGSGTGWDAQVVAWAAVDQWARAKSVDPSVADEANGLIAKYRKYFPTVGDGHQRQIAEGASYKIGCWINVTTTARFSE